MSTTMYTKFKELTPWFVYGDSWDFSGFWKLPRVDLTVSLISEEQSLRIRVKCQCNVATETSSMKVLFALVKFNLLRMPLREIKWVVHYTWRSGIIKLGLFGPRQTGINCKERFVIYHHEQRGGIPDSKGKMYIVRTCNSENWKNEFLLEFNFR